MRVALGLALLCGLRLVVAGGWMIAGLGVVLMIAAVAYSVGRQPLAWRGLGEVMAFVFFGPVAVGGTVYLQTAPCPSTPSARRCRSACLVAAIMVVNNLRDIPTDRATGKHTLAVRIGPTATRRLYAALVACAFCLLAAARTPAIARHLAGAARAAPGGARGARRLATRRCLVERQPRRHGAPAGGHRQAPRRGVAVVTVARVEVLPYRLPLRRPWHTAAGTLTDRAGFLVRLTDSNGRCGFGEASPVYWAGGESLACAAAALDAAAEWLAATRPVHSLHDTLCAGARPCAPIEPPAALRHSPAARCAIDTALLDLLARAAGQSVAALLSPDGADDAVACNGLVSDAAPHDVECGRGRDW